MRKRYLLLMMLFTQLITGTAFAADPPESQYNMAKSSIVSGDTYYIVTEVAGVEYYVNHDGELVAKDPDELWLDNGAWTINIVTGGALYTEGFHLEGGNGHFSNTTLNGNVANLNPGTGKYRLDTGNNRNDWESQVFYMNNEAKFAIRSCNTQYGESSWADAGRAFWTYTIAESVPSPCYSYDAAYVWRLQDFEGKFVELPADEVQVMNILDGLFGGEGIYKDFVDDDRDFPVYLDMGEAFGQLSDWTSWYAFYDLIQEIVPIYYDLEAGGTEYPELATVEGWKSTLAELYKKIIDSEVPYTVEDGYYRIIAHNRYKSSTRGDENGFVDMAMAASYSADHANKAVYNKLNKENASFIWKLTKSESGDSILLQNLGMGTYVSQSSSNRIDMTDDVTQASYVVFDYAGLEYVEPEGFGDDYDVFSIRLAREPRDGNYFHQNNHSSADDASSPWGTYGNDTNQEQELSFWIRTWNNNRTTDLWTSEWYLMPVDPSEDLDKLVEDFAIIKDHDILVEKNQELRDKVAETLELAKDKIRTTMITSADQLDNRYGDPSEGTKIANLIDGDATTFWHTTWHGLAEGVDYFVYEDAEGNTYDCHFLQISGMGEMVGDCELFLQEREGADNDRVKSLALFGSDDPEAVDESWELITTITLPHTGKSEKNNVPFTMDKAYQNIRVVVYDVASSSYAFRSFWHAAEIQFYTIKDNPNSQFANLGQVAQDLQDTYDANCAIPDTRLTLADYEALLAAYETFLKSGLVDPAELRAALAKYAKATEGVVVGQNPGQWPDDNMLVAFNDLYSQVEDYNAAGKYDLEEIHKLITMLKAMQKSLNEKVNGVETDKWYRIMYPTEEQFDAYGFNKDGGDNCDALTPEDQKTMWGTFVTAAKLESEEQISYDDDNNEVKTTISWLETISDEDLRESDRLFFMSDAEIDTFKDPSMFRFVEYESDPDDYTPLFMDTKENMGLALDMNVTYTRGEALITDAAQLSSNASDESEGKDLGALLDGNTSTFWHSDWHVKVIAPPYLQVAFEEPVSGLIQVEITRRNNGFGHIVRMFIVGSNDGETWTNIGYLEAPCDGTPSSVVSCLPVDLGGSYKYLRFINTCRWLNGGGNSTEMDPFAQPKSSDEYDKTWTYFHAAEFQIYPVTPAKELTASEQALSEAYAVANKVLIKDVTAEDFTSAAQGYATFKDEFNAAEGKAVLPDGISKAPSTYALQNKATGLFVFVDGTGNQNNVYLKTIPTLYTYKAIGYERSLLGGKNLAGQSTNYMHAGESNRRFCTWSTTEPTTNSGLIICEADVDYEVPAEFTFSKDVREGRYIDWCHSVTLNVTDAPSDAAAYTAVGQYTLDEGEETAETFLVMKAIETIPAGEPAIFLYGDTARYADENIETIKFTIPGDEKPVLEGKTVNGLIGTLVTYPIDKYLIYFDGPGVAVPTPDQNLAVTPCSAVLDLELCPVIDPDEVEYDIEISLGQAAKDVADGVKNISSTLEKISQPGNVYTMDGKLLRTGATLNSVKAMGKGIYILNGVKVVVK